jgi:hypothetical protein
VSGATSPFFSNLFNNRLQQKPIEKRPIINYHQHNKKNITQLQAFIFRMFPNQIFLFCSKSQLAVFLPLQFIGCFPNQIFLFCCKSQLAVFSTSAVFQTKYLFCHFNSRLSTFPQKDHQIIIVHNDTNFIFLKTPNIQGINSFKLSLIDFDRVIGKKEQ